MPSTPVLYLGMDDDNGKKEGGVSKNEQFGEGWERDPNRINPHLQVILCIMFVNSCICRWFFVLCSYDCFTHQVMWDDLIGEPEGVRSLDCTWNCSKTCFQVNLGSMFDNWIEKSQKGVKGQNIFNISFIIFVSNLKSSSSNPIPHTKGLNLKLQL